MPSELRPYKYAGYPMLVATIRLEAEDEQLFSKEAPLLSAAAEVAYYTVRCSALNAEELRRERGLEVRRERGLELRRERGLEVRRERGRGEIGKGIPS